MTAPRHNVHVTVPGTREFRSVLDDRDFTAEEHVNEDDYAVTLPHRCDAWVIGCGSLEEVRESVRALRRELDLALFALDVHAATRDGDTTTPGGGC